jgi:hypothetical protein
MFDKIEFEPSAFKHGILRIDSERCIWYPEYSNFLTISPLMKILYIGYSRFGDPLEVIGKKIDFTLSIYHAMPLRKNWYHYLINEKRRKYGNR